MPEWEYAVVQDPFGQELLVRQRDGVWQVWRGHWVAEPEAAFDRPALRPLSWTQARLWIRNSWKR